MEKELTSLPSDTVRLIGSSQVITSVFSVVKELVENALDSGASVIDVKLENYGLDKVEVRDNGHGIKQCSMPCVAKRYHTSKIASFSDLESLSTYGFRGEALGSLCAVSSLSITSKTAEESVSFTYVFDNHGSIESNNPSHLGQGTTICASHLFKNLPVRRQFYNTAKKKKEELKRIEDLLMSYGAIRPGARLLLKHGKDTVWQKNGVTDTKTALLGIMGRSVVTQLEHKIVTCEDPEMVIECFLPRPKSESSQTSRSTNDRCFVAVNGRPVQVKEIEKCVKQYYCTCMDVDGRYPICYIALTIPTTDIDVNVDPNKTRVMLHQQKLILSEIEKLCEKMYGPLKNKKDSLIDQNNSLEDSQNSSLNDSELTPDYRDIRGKIKTTGICQAISGHQIQFDSLKSYISTTVSSEETCDNSGFKISIHEPKASNEGAKVSNYVEGEMDKMAEIEMDKDNKMAEEDSRQVVTEYPSMTPGSFDFLDDDLEELLKSQHSNNKTINDTLDDIATELLGDFGQVCKTAGNSNTNKENRIDREIGPKSMDNNAQGSRIKDMSIPVINQTNTDDELLHEVKSNLDVSKPDSTHINEPLRWSLGKCEVGSGAGVLQPVTLLVPNSSLTSNKRSHPDTDDELMAFTPSPKRKSLTLQPNQPRLYEVVGKSPKEKYSLGFTAFSREERPRVMKENLNLSYDDVSKFVNKKWENLSDSDKKQYEDRGKVQIEDLKRKALEKQRLSSKPSKRIEQYSNIKERMMSAMKSTAPPIPSVKVKFSISRLRDLYQSGIRQSQCQSNPKMSLIGPLKFYNGWICFHGNKVKVINPHRVEETILFRELLENHVISSTKMETPIKLDASVLGQALFPVLVNMIPSDSSQTYTYIQDKRITANGFHIRCHLDANSCPVVELDGISKCIPTFGIQDLKEVVQLIHEMSATSLDQCRPLKVIYYLQGEAVRMIRQKPLMRNKEDMNDILEQMCDTLPEDSSQCLHDKPLLHTLYDMADITASQLTQHPL